MNLKDLEIFQKVVETGTVTEAAKELNYVQSNITSRINVLEKEFNTILFHRHHRGMSLTPEGKKLLTYSKKILSLAEEMKEIIQYSGEPAGKLEIGAVETVIQLPKILSIFVEKYNHVDLSLITGVTEKLEEDVLNYRLDGAFVCEADFHSDLICHDVIEEELVLISNKNVSSIEELIKEPILCLNEGCEYRARLKKWFEDNKFKPQKIMLFGTLEMILQSVVAGLGITFVPKSAVTQLEKKDLIYSYELPEKYSNIKTVFIRRKDGSLTPTLEKFIEIIELKKQKHHENQHTKKEKVNAEKYD